MMTGILIIHGFAGTRKEMEPLSKHLEKCGFTVSVPLLTGHESTRKNLAGAKNEDWLNSAKAAGHTLKKQCEKLIIVGFSTGGHLLFETDTSLCVCSDIKNFIM